MNCVFLDIDGPLVHARSVIANRKGMKRKGWEAHEFDPVSAGLVIAICREFDVKIVISSTWRLNSTIDGVGNEHQTLLYRCLKANHLLEYLHPDWRTKDLHRFSKKGDLWVPGGGNVETERLVRGDEIKEWLGRHPEVTRAAILDDDADMLPEQLPYFVHCQTTEGISYANYRQLEQIFSGKSLDISPRP